MILPFSIVNPLTRIEVLRQLPQPGKVLVRERDIVESFQLVGEYTPPPQFAIVNISRELAVPPKKIARYLNVAVGDAVEEGAVLASRGGFGGRACRAPFSGTVTGSGRGRLLLEAPSRPVQLSALLPGTVARILPGEGAVIQAWGTFIQGVWGNGKEVFGVLRVVARGARQSLRAKKLDASLQGAIIVGGAGLDEEALEQAAEVQVGGIIVGGVSPQLMPRLLAVPFPVVVIDGVGKVSMSEVVFKLLRSLEGREVALSGIMPDLKRPVWSRLGNVERPFVAVPMPSQSGAAVDRNAPLILGSRVRALRQPYMGMSGVVVEIPSGLTLLETGARRACVKVEFEGETALVPHANLELLL
ncbi:MAG: hypothetical protein BWY63_02966 [Chloroflexi bacterium ADurb.Bin360]|nr:MAG: hypothetical protein BWY63_02966 [Chloroflexi bacterium ADurb.Bin360]